jgi:hypothetical protein
MPVTLSPTSTTGSTTGSTAGSTTSSTTSSTRTATPAQRPAPPLTTRAASAPELFVVATHKVRDRGTATQWLPYGTEHAWQPGTRRTLCGEWTAGWTVFWDRHFSARPAAACAACVEATLPEASRRRLDRIATGSPA